MGFASVSGPTAAGNEPGYDDERPAVPSLENTMLKVIRSAALLIALAAPAAAADKPVGLPPKEAADGWVMLFDGETTFGWKVDGEATVRDGKLVVGGAKPTKLETTAHFASVEWRVDYHTPEEKSAKGVRITQLAHVYDFGFGVRGRTGAVWVSLDDSAGPIRIETPANRVVIFDSIQLRPKGHRRSIASELTPLFNGKDLTGWHVFKDPAREKATFTVTPAGELHVLGGPGDLQTDAKFADFVLQAEVKTNGPTVNSGIFFRCVPGEYQNGYECQIQNAFKDGDRTKPADGGTGAIYRRQAARKVVPNDGEWFTLTVAANGPHLATWVNGYPTASWTDDRKPHENPRNGLRTEAGHISIQGHNPPMAADVLFRNVRIAEVKK